jgi:hypothetical protein
MEIGISQNNLEALSMQLENKLSNVRGKTFLMDLEDTVVMGITTFDIHDEKSIKYLTIPSMCTLAGVLAKRNTVIFYTSATKENVTSLIMPVLPDNIRSVPVIDADDMNKIIRYVTKPSALISKNKILKIVQSFCADATSSTLEIGSNIIRDFVSNNGKNKQSGIEFARKFKFPQIFVSPEKGYLIDNGYEILQKAVAYGWPTDHAIHYLDAQGGDTNFTSAINVSEKILKSISKN